MVNCVVDYIVGYVVDCVVDYGRDRGHDHQVTMSDISPHCLLAAINLTRFVMAWLGVALYPEMYTAVVTDNGRILPHLGCW